MKLRTAMIRCIVEGVVRRYRREEIQTRVELQIAWKGLSKSLGRIIAVTFGVAACMSAIYHKDDFR